MSGVTDSTGKRGRTASSARIAFTCAITGAIVFLNSIGLLPSRALAADDLPGQVPPSLARQHSDEFALRVEELVADGTPRTAAEELARGELLAEGSTECLAYPFCLIWCEGGSIRRAYKRIDSNCIDDIATTQGCTPLTCPPGWAPPAPCPLPTCTAPQVPMWDTIVDPNCAGLPTSVSCVWMHPTSTTPAWGPCPGVLKCDCFPEIEFACQSLVVECRNPAAPCQEGDLCPNCRQGG